jgi:hypothetical protein
MHALTIPANSNARVSHYFELQNKSWHHQIFTPTRQITVFLQFMVCAQILANYHSRQIFPTFLFERTQPDNILFENQP